MMTQGQGHSDGVTPVDSTGQHRRARYAPKPSHGMHWHGSGSATEAWVAPRVLCPPCHRHLKGKTAQKPVFYQHCFPTECRAKGRRRAGEGRQAQPGKIAGALGAEEPGDRDISSGRGTQGNTTRATPSLAPCQCRCPFARATWSSAAMLPALCRANRCRSWHRAGGLSPPPRMLPGCRAEELPILLHWHAPCPAPAETAAGVPCNGTAPVLDILPWHPRPTAP